MVNNFIFLITLFLILNLFVQFNFVFVFYLTNKLKKNKLKNFLGSKDAGKTIHKDDDKFNALMKKTSELLNLSRHK